MFMPPLRSVRISSMSPDAQDEWREVILSEINDFMKILQNLSSELVQKLNEQYWCVSVQVKQNMNK